MIVALEHIWRQSTGSITMAEVETEEDAFAEMRRFLAVNNIPSDTTTVCIVDEHEYLGQIIPRHKEIYMCQRGFIPPMIQEYPNPCFGIYFGADEPRGKKLKHYSEYGIEIKKSNLTGDPVTDSEGHPILIHSGWLNDENKWYMPLYLYLEDLKQRNGGNI